MRDIAFVWDAIDLEVARDAVSARNRFVAESILGEKYLVELMSESERREFLYVTAELQSLVEQSHLSSALV